MKYVSTKGQSPAISISQALKNGIAPDGGLYIPEAFPLFEMSDFDHLNSFAEISAKVLAPFFAEDELYKSLPAICERAFSFPLILKPLGKDTSVLELFHGPTSAFKDVGARFLAECFLELKIKEQTILVATSGDTGGAVAAAFHKKAGIKVVILFPKNGVSELQRKQLTCWGDNVSAMAVDGSFDDCQKIVKTAFADSTLSGLSSANSINIGRLLPQMCYYVASSLWYFREHKRKPAYSVPSGNFGNALSGLWAKTIGLPIRHIGMATNANCEVPDYFSTGVWQPKASIPTLANAMDVGNPSNMERIFKLRPELAALKADTSSRSVSDDEIQKVILEGEKNWNEIWCPHTATAVHFREQEKSADWIIVSTAHPAKFDTIVEPLIGHKVKVPEALTSLLNRPSACTDIAADYKAFKKAFLYSFSQT